VNTVSNQSIVATAKLLRESQSDDEQFLIAEIMMQNMLNDRELESGEFCKKTKLNTRGYPCTLGPIFPRVLVTY
jgi:hypothetical protein